MEREAIFKCPQCGTDEIEEMRCKIANADWELLDYCTKCDLILLDAESWIDIEDIEDICRVH